MTTMQRCTMMLAGITATVLLVQQLYNNKKRTTDENSVNINLPPWAYEYYKSLKELPTSAFATMEQRMAIAIELSKRNVEEGTGGPFGTAIFERDRTTMECTIFSVGVNRVVPLNNSTLHGEMIAIQFAQAKKQTFSLKADPTTTDGKDYLLYTSCEPCCMCLGGTFWSGVSEMVCAATKDDAEAIGFQEGPVFADSYIQLETVAGVKVTRNVLREEGRAVLQAYAKDTKNLIYNA